MNRKLFAVLMFGCLSFNACAAIARQNVNRTNEEKSSSAKVETNTNTSAVENAAAKNAANESAEAQTKQPRTVRDFFNLLSQKYFPLEGCEPAKDKNCERARREYVKNYLETEDTANGFWKSGCDGAQSCLNLALFKRSDASYIVAVHTTHETDEKNYFLEYKSGKWTDISRQIVPEFSDKNIYELPQKGTTVKVFKKDYPEPEYSERGAQIYELEWKNGKFEKKK